MKKKIAALLLVCSMFSCVSGIFFSNAVNAATSDDDNMLLGNPSGATSNTSNSNNYLMIKPQYDFSYNNSKHEPNWTS
jgi:endonuclease G